MRRLLLLLTSLAGPIASAAPYLMTLHKVVDEQGIHGVAYRYLAPKGWKVDTKFGWTDAILQPTIFAASADSPDGQFGYSVLGGMDLPFSGVTGSHQFYGVQSGSSSGTPPPAKLTDFLLKLAQEDKTLSDIRVTRRVDRPLSADQMAPGRRYGTTSELDYTFVRNGRTLSCISAARMDVGLFGDPRQEGQAYNGDWKITDAFTVYSPPGEEKKGMRFFSLAAPTYTPTRAFVVARGAYIMALNQKILQGIAQIGELSKLRAQISRKQEDAIMGRYRADQQAKDKAQSAFCDYIGDVAHHVGPDGNDLQSNSNLGDPWVDSHGNVAFGDGPGFNPNEGTGGGWTKLKKAGE